MLRRRDKSLLVIASLVCLLLTWWLARLLHVPTFPGMSGALLAQPRAIIAIIAVALCVGVGVVIASIICATVRHDAGLLCAAVGLAAISFRAGPMSRALLSATGPGIYLSLATELVVLFVILALGKLLQSSLMSTGLVKPEGAYDRLPERDTSPGEGVAAMALGTAIMSLVCLILIQSDNKAQAIISVGVGAILASSFARRFVPAGPVVWFVAIPLITGLIGHIGTYILDPGGWTIGVTRGLLAPLARPLPLDYASVGTACAIYGYWMGRHAELERCA
jgi:hypothetical protein